jgi:glucan endo-1,3-alpha-glucosidase
MIAVSPWFSTHFNTKNWVFVCENLPTLRWEQMLSLQPDLIEIITWNGTLPSYPRKIHQKSLLTVI